jgi:oligosaccharyltransferase complex subunit delta (ribophorin II)
LYVELRRIGKKKRDILTSSQTQRDLPVQLLTSQQPLEASLVLGSFGSSKGSVTPVFDITLEIDPNTPSPPYEAPLRYGKQPEIHHIFRAEPKNPPKLVSIAFALAVLATVPALFIGVRNHGPLALKQDGLRKS